MRRTALVLLLAMVAVVAPQLTPGRAQEGFDVTVSPAKLELAAEPGTSREFDINIRNSSPDEETLDVYFMDYYISPKNEIAFREPGHYSYSCATWLSTETPDLAVPAGQVVKKRFKVAIPPGAEPGGHYGVIFFQQAPPDTGEPEIVGLSARIGSVILITVPGEIVREGVIESVSVGSMWFWPSRKAPLLPRSVPGYKVAFKNTGNVHLTVKGKLTYTPSFGWGSGAIELGEMTVLPKTTRYFEGVLPKPPFLGSYEVKAEVSYGPSLYEFDTTRTKSAAFSCYPLALLLIPLVIIAVVIALVKLRSFLRRKKRKEEEKE